MGTKKAKTTKKHSKRPAFKFKNWLKLFIVFSAGVLVGYWLATNRIQIGQLFNNGSSSNGAQKVKGDGLTLESLKIDEPNGPDKNFADGCRNGIVPACHMWGFRKKEKGLIDEARFLFKYACDKGYELACSNLESLK